MYYENLVSLHGVLQPTNALKENGSVVWYHFCLTFWLPIESCEGKLSLLFQFRACGFTRRSCPQVSRFSNFAYGSPICLLWKELGAVWLKPITPKEPLSLELVQSFVTHCMTNNGLAVIPRFLYMLLVGFYWAKDDGNLPLVRRIIKCP